MTWNLIGHEWAVQLLQNHIKNNTLRHAYLITGPEAIGKKNLALRFMQAICCTNPTEPGNPCLKCSTCSRLARMEHPDLFPIMVEEGSKQIKIDQVRELIHSLSLTPYETNRRFGLLLDFDKANRNAQNSLLKTLEEPPGSVILILTARSTSHLFDTVASRCEEIKLNPVPIQTTQHGLEDLYQIQTEEAKMLAHISGGKPELALAYHTDPDLRENRENLLDQHKVILKNSIVDRFHYAGEISKDSKRVRAMVDCWGTLWVDVLRVAGKSNAPLQNIDRIDEIQDIAGKVDLQETRRIISQLQRTHHLLDINANLKLTVENLFLQLPKF
jgi:DNA polymerase-3 subunit delta'